MHEVTRILNAIDHGDAQAAEELLPAVYDELRALATQRLRQESPGQTLQATALVHEAYLRVVGRDSCRDPKWSGRGHFFAAAAEAMRRILIDRARAKGAAKRGGSYQKLRLETSHLTLENVRKMGAKTIEPTEQRQDEWVAHHDELANATLVVRTNSWYMGSNVEGKPRRLLSYIGGVGPYKQRCDEVTQGGYRGFDIQ